MFVCFSNKLLKLHNFAHILIFSRYRNFSDYRGRFSMPGNADSLMYSFDMGPVHFISISTEFYYFLEYGLKLVVGQYEWLQRDLEVSPTL